MDDVLLIRSADLDDINTIGFLAQQIWPEAYGSILSPDQLSFMLQLFYSPRSLEEQMLVSHHQFFIAELEEEPVGFASYGKLTGTGQFKLHKCYVLGSQQGKGLGKALLDVVCDHAREDGGKQLFLNVNRNNPALQFYKKMGFEIVREEDVPIGNDYFMNDFVMSRRLD